MNFYKKPISFMIHSLIQFSISYDPGGLQDLENIIRNQFTINKSKQAYDNFKDLINFITENKVSKLVKILQNLIKIYIIYSKIFK